MTAWMKGKNPGARVKKNKVLARIPIIAVLVHTESENRQLSSRGPIGFHDVEQCEN